MESTLNPYSDALLAILRGLLDQVIEAMDGMPEEDLATWRTPLAHGEVSTMYGLAVHIAGAGEHWTLEAAGARASQFNRLKDFTARGSIAEISARYDDWMTELEAMLREISDEELRALYVRKENRSRGVGATSVPKASANLLALSHTALHVGHMQVQRQLWGEEQAQRSANAR